MRRLSPLSLGLFGVFAACLIACSPTPAEPPAAKSKVEQTLDQTSDFLAKQPNYAFDLSFAIEQQAGELQQSQENQFEIRYQKPDKFAIESEKGETGVTFVSDGEQAHVMLPDKRYIKEDAKRNLQEIASMILAHAAPLVVPSKDMTDKILKGTKNSEYVGLEKLDGEDVHHLKAVKPQFDWHLWISAGDQPLFQRMMVDYAKSEKDLGAQVKVEYRFRDWRVDVDFPKGAFTFKPPKDAKLVESFNPRANSAEDLVGEPAPVFTVDKLGEGKVDLAEHKGKDVVVLDFWATWCGPCVKALPTIAKVTRQFKDKGVVFYAVNLREDPADVRAFLKDMNLDVPVALDATGEVAQMYRAAAIPQTVIIGKDGLVQKVHVGLLPDLEEQLTRELNALVRGEKP